MFPFGLSLTTLLLIMGGILLGVVALGVLLGVLLPSFGVPRAAAKNLDEQRTKSANWARYKDVKKDLASPSEPDPRRLPLCRLNGKSLSNRPYRSIQVIAPSGAGKTPRVVVPAVLGHFGPAVITSIKGDVLELTRAARAAQGKIWVFDPSCSLGPTARWSPLGHIRTWADALDAARWIQESSKANSGTGGIQDHAFWDAQARFLLAPLMYMTALAGNTMGDVADLVVGGQETEDFITKQLQNFPESGPRTYWARFMGLENKTKSSVLITAATVLECWTHPRIAEAVNVPVGDRNILNLDDFLAGNNTLYLVAPATAQAQFTPIYESLINAITMRVEQEYSRRGSIALNPPLLLALDEAANIAPLRRLDYLASAGAGQGIMVLSIWQDEGQQIEIYGQAKARTISANHYAKIYLSGIQDHQTLSNLSEQIGRAVMQQTSTSRYRDGTSTTTSYQELAVAPPSWIRQLALGKAIIILGHYPPILGEVTAWYEDKNMRNLIPDEVAERFDRAFGTFPKKKLKKSLTSNASPGTQVSFPSVQSSSMGNDSSPGVMPTYGNFGPRKKGVNAGLSDPANSPKLPTQQQRDESAQGWFVNDYRKNLNG